MIRPISIVRYERLYLASFVLGLIVSAMSWTQRTAMIAANPVLANIGWILPAFQIIGVVITLLLWHFTARSPSVVAKWIVVALAVLSVVGVGMSLVSVANGRTMIGTTSIVSFAADALYIAAAFFLFKADAKLWFAELPNADASLTFEDVSHDL